MPIFVGTLARYFGLRFLTAVLLVFAGIFALVTLVDYIELMRRAGVVGSIRARIDGHRHLQSSFGDTPRAIEAI